MKLSLVYVRIRLWCKMAYSSRDNCNTFRKEQLIVKLDDLSVSVSKLSETVTLEAFFHYALVTGKLEELCEDVEQIQLIVDNLMTKVVTLNMKVDNITIKEKTVTLGFLKKVSEIQEIPSPNEQVVSPLEEPLGQNMDLVLLQMMEAYLIGQEGNLQAKKDNNG